MASRIDSLGDNKASHALKLVVVVLPRWWYCSRPANVWYIRSFLTWDRGVRCEGVVSRPFSGDEQALLHSPLARDKLGGESY